ncbi:uncharacterized protein LOC103506749 isoform X2 [Diaphorina citri]|uniref:DNA polymerase eta n=3 Tax=Diaphorina citri TaxID=121845 RepID=A0A1S4E8H0_DIACI|nr:uncharacterized protein LOC103506749 isoform X1 [Diaphorina citri]XP_026677531.1 uncharacterized protein LOC103506749 isoform X2 [Diaphorina citri]
MTSRIIALIDMDCFYCQVECKLNPSLHGKPLAVVQYNTWKGGGIIAVNYEARHKGVTRHMRGDEAKQHCPEIELCRVPSVRGKADISKYRNAGREVIAVLSEFSNIVERASIDEAYIDLTDVVHERMKSIGHIAASQLSNTFVVGFGPDNNDEDARKAGVMEWLGQVYSDTDTSLMENTEDFQELAIAGVIVEEIRAAVLSKTQFHCSAGIAHNKVLAKLVCGLHKPQKQSILPQSSVSMLYANLSIKKVRHLGGKLGDEVVETLQCSTMLELEKFSLKQLQSHFEEKTASWLYYIARGIDHEPVNARLVSKSIGCCKRFPGKTCLATRQDVSHWIQELADEVCERLEDDLTLNKRRAQLLTVSFTQETDGKVNSCSRSIALASYKLQDIVEVSMQVINKTNSAPPISDLWTPPLLFLGLSASKFSPLGSHPSIQQFFKPQDHPEPMTSEHSSLPEQSTNHDSKKRDKTLLNFNQQTPFQLALNRIERKLIDKFKSHIESKLDSCNANVDKLVIGDISEQIKNIAAENVRKYLRTHSKDSNASDEDEESFNDKLVSIEREVEESVGKDIEESLKNVSDVLFNEKVENLTMENKKSIKNECLSPVSSKSKDLTNENLGHTFETLPSPILTSDRSNVSSSGDIHTSTPCRRKGSKNVFENKTLKTKEELPLVKRVDNTIPNSFEFITYTRRQVKPENISNGNNSDNKTDDEDSPQVITKPIGSISMRKYETTRQSHLNKPKLFADFPTTSQGNNPDTHEPPNSSNKRGKSYSFFENYLRRKKERERLNSKSCKDETLTHGQVHPSVETNTHTILEEVTSPIETVDNGSIETNSMTRIRDDIHLARENNTKFLADPIKDTESTSPSNVMSNEIIDQTTIRDVSSSDHSQMTSATKADKESADPNNEMCKSIVQFHSNSINKVNMESSVQGNGNADVSPMDTVDIINTIADSSTVDSAINIADPTKIICDKCSQPIDINELQEHQDYHFALELSTTSEPPNSTSNISNSSSSSKILNKKSSKRGRPSKLNSFKNSENFKKLKTIDQFFKPKSQSLS